MTATLFFVTNIVVLYNAYNREPQTWFCVIRQISRISKSGVFKGGISPSGLSPLALYADYPFIIRSYAIYIGQEKPPDGTACFFSGHGFVSSVATQTETDIPGFCHNYSCYDAFICHHDGKWCVNDSCSGNVVYLFACRSAWTKL